MKVTVGILVILGMTYVFRAKIIWIIKQIRFEHRLACFVQAVIANKAIDDVTIQIQMWRETDKFPEFEDIFIDGCIKAFGEYRPKLAEVFSDRRMAGRYNCSCILH